MRFEEIRGQEQAVATLRGDITSGRVASAYLFSGPGGVGKRTTAQAFAAALNCLRGGTSSCGVCHSCVAAGKGIHPDIRLWRRDKKTVVSIDLLREEILPAIMLKPYEGRYKVAILDEAEILSTEAANAFLLTLEEPPPHTVFILLAVNRQMLPETVVSRCRSVYFSPLPDAVVEELLTEGSDIPRPEAARAAVLGEGSLADAREYLSEEWRQAWRDGLSLLEGILSGGEDCLGHGSTASAAKRENAERLIVIQEKLARLSLRQRLGLGDPAGETWAPVAALASRLDTGGFARLLESLHRAKLMLKGNVGSRLVAEGYVIELSRLLRVGGPMPLASSTLGAVGARGDR